MKALIPGTVIPYAGFDGDVFELFRPALRAANGFSLAQVCAITGLDASCIQNWVKRGFVPHPVRKRYHERQLARILTISALRESMQLEKIVQLLALVNGDVESESDDLIQESRLYELLCRLIRQEFPLSRADAEKTVTEMLSDYEEPRPGGAARLKDVLIVMFYACLSARVKQEADRSYAMLSQKC